MAHLCIYESTKRNISKPKDNTNQPPSFVVSAKSMYQLVSAGDIMGRVQDIDLSLSTIYNIYPSNRLFVYAIF